MIILDCEQGSDEWKQARLGIPTASRFDQIIQPKKLLISASIDKYIGELLAEWLLGEPLDGEQSDFMVRGSALEQEAIDWYEFETGQDAAKVGFCLRDDKRVGCSPDFLVGQNGGGEVKCPSPAVHMMYVMNPQKLIDKYRCQVQGGLWLAQRDWWDMVSYHPTLPKVWVRVERDEKFIPKLDECMEIFLEQLEQAKQEIGALAA